MNKTVILQSCKHDNPSIQTHGGIHFYIMEGENIKGELKKKEMAFSIFPGHSSGAIITTQLRYNYQWPPRSPTLITGVTGQVDF